VLCLLSSVIQNVNIVFFVPFEYRLRGEVIVETEPPRDCRRLLGLSYAAMAGCSSMA
jgi:hypothetical protein